MIKINLISPEQKNKLEKKKVYAAISRSIAVIFIFAAILSGLLWGAKFYLQSQLEQILAQNQSGINEAQQLAASIKKVNAKISAVASVQSDHYRWSPLLVELSRLTPPTIAFESVLLYQSESALEITGSAQTRNDLINYQKSLEDSGWFKKVDLPLEALISKENNNFTIKATLDLNKTTSL